MQRLEIVKEVFFEQVIGRGVKRGSVGRCYSGVGGGSWLWDARGEGGVLGG